MLPDLLSTLPASLADQLAEYQPDQVLGGHSGTQIYRLTQPGQATLYLKIGAQDLRAALADEAARLVWLQNKVPVPQVHYFSETETGAYLLISEVSGMDTSDKAYADDLPTMVRLLGEGLRCFHQVPIDDCPFDETLAVTLARARQRTEAGFAPADRLAELESKRPATEELVLTHGDYCLPNVLLHEGQVSGFIDLGRVGIADRYQDLALAVRSLEYNFGPGWAPQFFTAYGIVPDWAKVEFYQLLDEFF